MRWFHIARLLQAVLFYGFLMFAAFWLVFDPVMPPETHFMGAIIAVILVFMLFHAVRKELHRLQSPF